MAIFRFTRAILEGDEIEVYNHGRMQRDFTYIDDVVAGVVAVLDRPPRPHDGLDPMHPLPSVSAAPYRVLNIGNHAPVPLLDFIAAIEHALGRRARQRLLPMQPGDVVATYADVSRLAALTGFTPATPLNEGVRRFVEWYCGYYRAA